jgi:hypothetical protein
MDKKDYIREKQQRAEQRNKLRKQKLLLKKLSNGKT